MEYLKPVTGIEMLYKLWNVSPDEHRLLYSGIVHPSIDADEVLYCLGALAYNRHTQQVYEVMKDWLKCENERRKEFNKRFELCDW